MSEMVYSNRRITEVLLEGEYLGYEWVIVSYGTHPCAYVKLPNNSKLIPSGEEVPVSCHGGITYTSSKGLPQLKVAEKNEGCYIGWDYAHYGDQCGLNSLELGNLGDKRWTVNEIQTEIRDVIIQLIELENE